MSDGADLVLLPLGGIFQVIIKDLVVVVVVVITVTVIVVIAAVAIVVAGVVVEFTVGLV